MFDAGARAEYITLWLLLAIRVSKHWYWCREARAEAEALRSRLAAALDENRQLKARLGEPVIAPAGECRLLLAEVHLGTSRTCEATG